MGRGVFRILAGLALVVVAALGSGFTYEQIKLAHAPAAQGWLKAAAGS